MRKGAKCNAVMALALFASAHSANAHGIAGNRFFVGTLTFDDPSVADEAIVPNFSTLNHPVEGGNAVDNRFDWSFTRLPTPVLQGGNSTGFRVQLLFFLDDLIPKLFDKPLLSDKPDRSLIAWH